MKLPLDISAEPMEATSVAEFPTGEDWQFEPKWDGFRCLCFRNGDDVQLQSKSGQSLARYFPELVASIQKLRAPRFVLDSEIVVPIGRRFSFDSLLQRIHPAASRVAKLSVETPAMLIVFDLLVGADGESVFERPLNERRKSLEKFARKYLKGRGIKLSPASTELRIAGRWWQKVGDNLDGIICKRTDLPYRFGLRDGMVKVKKHRTADCVVGGFRYAAKGKQVGSLLLGLYDAEGKLDHVGFTSAFANEDKAALTAKLEKLVGGPGFTGKAPGGPSRWSTKRSSEWQPLKPKLVVEVAFDHFTGGRFRHGTGLVRWRPDKKPSQCRMDQVEQAHSNSMLLLELKA